MRSRLCFLPLGDDCIAPWERCGERHKQKVKELEQPEEVRLHLGVLTVRTP